MGRSVTAVFSGVIACFALTALAQTPVPQRPRMPPRDVQQAQQSAGTGSISGRVTAADTGSPLRRVQVRLTGAELRGPRTALTDPDGRYTLESLPAGRYTLSLIKPGFAQIQYGQKRPQQPGTPIDVAEGQHVRNIDVAMPRGGVIAGFVYDEFGEPVVDARVMALQHRWLDGRRRLFPAARPGLSNDRGEFRIWGLPPGEYFLSATGGEHMRIREPGAQDAGDDTGYATTYFPGTASMDQAQRIAVTAGQEATGIVFTLVMTRTVRVSGIAVTSENRPMAGGHIMVLPRGELGGVTVTSSGAMIDGKGNFTLTNVVPGEYVLIARGPRTPGVGGPDAPQEVASMPLVVGTEDITNLVLAASRGARVSGRIAFETAPPADGTERIRVVLVSPEETMMFGSGSGQVDARGAFEIRGVTGRRSVMLAGLPSGLAVKSVRIDGREYLDSDYDFDRVETAGVEIVVTDRVTTLSGTVRDSGSQPLKDYVVLAFSTDETHWRPRSRRTSSARPDQNGIYRLRALPPGSYHVLALEEMPEEWGNPELFERLRPLASEVTLREAETKALELKVGVIPD